MFDFVHENKRVIQVILMLLVFPFAWFGVNSYRQSSGGDALVTVDGEKITQQEFENTLRQLRGRVNPALLDSPEGKLGVLERMVNEKLLMVKARAAGLEPTDRQLAQFIAEMAEFQTDGKFDAQKYSSWLDSQGVTAPVMQERLKQDIAYRLITTMYAQNGYASDTAAEYLARAVEQQRMVSVARVNPDDYLKQVKVDDATVRKYYDGNKVEFGTPESARVEYVIFSADSLQAQTTASADEIKQYYEEHKAEYSTPEQRHAAHILIIPADKSGEAGKKAAREKAESILKQVRQTPGKFADLAKQNSEDPGSRAKGGDLGFFSRGAMVKQFEDAAFGLKPGEISGIVESDYGFHIIKMLEVKGGGTTPLEEVKTAIAAKIKLQKAGSQFAELADKFNDTAYTQSDSLKPAAELAKATVQQSGWLKKGQPGAFPWNDKALQAVFSEDVLKKKRNSSAIEIAPDKLIAVRLLDYKPAGTQPFEEVAADIKKRLMHQQASELAAKQGQAMLAQLQHGEKTSVKWDKVQDGISRMHPAKGVDGALAQGVLQADVSKLPVYVGAELPQGGFVIARIDAVKDAGAIENAKRTGFAQQLRQATGEELLQAYVMEARKHASISAKDILSGKKG